MARPRWLRRPLVILLVLVGVAVAIRVALDPLASWRTKRVLAGMKGMRGTFQSVHVRLADLSYDIRGLRIEKIGSGGDALPFVHVERARFGLYWKELLRGHVVAGVELLRPRVNLIESNAPERRQSAPEAPEAGRGVERLAPLRIDRAEVKQGEVRWIDAREPREPELWLHGVEATLENYATRPALAKGEPTVVALSGTLQRSGRVSLFATADPLAKKVSFAGQAALRGLELREIGRLIASKTELAPEQGTLDLLLRFRADDGRLSGGLRPILHDADVKAAKGGLGPKLKAFLTDASLRIFSGHVSGAAEGVATTIPLEGSVRDPKAQAVPTILGIVRNAFVAGVENSLAGLPPPKAKKRQGTLEQARHALTPGRHEPRAQPEREATK